MRVDRRARTLTEGSMAGRRTIGNLMAYSYTILSGAREKVLAR
jgi:hypothetical protein